MGSALAPSFETIAIGIGIAFGNASLPSVIKILVQIKAGALGLPFARHCRYVNSSGVSLPLMGTIYDITASWVAPITFLVVGARCSAGFPVGRNWTVFFETEPASAKLEVRSATS